MTHHCPICKSVHDDKHNLAKHMRMATDNHEHIKTHEDAVAAIEGEDIDDTQPSEQRTEHSEGLADDSVLLDAPETSETQAQTTDTDTRDTPTRTDAKDEPHCPECDRPLSDIRWFDASTQTDYQFGCADCSELNQWVVFNE